jgi:hypothetical protein
VRAAEGRRRGLTFGRLRAAFALIRVVTSSPRTRSKPGSFVMKTVLLQAPEPRRLERIRSLEPVLGANRSGETEIIGGEKIVTWARAGESLSQIRSKCPKSRLRIWLIVRGSSRQSWQVSFSRFLARAGRHHAAAPQAWRCQHESRQILKIRGAGYRFGVPVESVYESAFTGLLQPAR